MENLPQDDTQIKTNWHIAKLDTLFPKTVTSGMWRSNFERFSKNVKEAFGIPTRPRYDPRQENQSIDLFDKANTHRNNFLRLTSQFRKDGIGSVEQNHLRNQIRDEAVQALKKFYDTSSVHIQKFYDRNVSYNERVAAFRRWTRTLDYSMDMYRKLKPVTGDNFTEIIKKCEDAQVEIRTDAIDELTMSDPLVLRAREDLAKGYISPSAAGYVAASARVRHTAEVMLHSIKTINPNRLDPNAEENRQINGFVIDDMAAAGGTIDIGGLQRYSANNTSYNCTRVVPATIGVVFGAKLKAVAALDDDRLDGVIRGQWRDAYESVYGSKFTSVNSLNELFDALEASPPGTTGIIFNHWRDASHAHVSVVANVAGVPCMVEGQTAEMIVRNPQTNKFETHRLTNNGVQISEFDPLTLENISFMNVGAERTTTEHQRATNVIEKLHSSFFDRESRLRMSDSFLPPPPVPLPYRDPSIPQPPQIGPPPPRISPPPVGR